MISFKSGRALYRGHIHGIHHLRHYAKACSIDRVLVANRGEIACRVMRTARKMGVQTVAVYSDADRGAMHVEMADEAYNIGPAPSQESYLRQDKIVEVAKKSGCMAIHPGYGFLSENVEFATLCQQEGLIFIGPPPSAIRDMGIKSTSKRIMEAAGVPVVPGYHGDDQDAARLRLEAERIGYPLLVKAVRGGGGKGMRVVAEAAELEQQLAAAQREALNAFGDGAVLLERFVRRPRHVEVQVFADSRGNCVHLFERDCSVQRRHQKVVEEAPAPGLPGELRRALGAAAVRAARAVGYVGAGTVEFILDSESLAFHFMEMNTRLQVEHPVTEMVTGTDLVQWQLQVAAGAELPLSQDELRVRGHAFEARVYAENPAEGFLPGAGPLLFLAAPPAQADVRVETGVRQGDEVSVHYDPMIAKLVVWGEDRPAALRKLRARLSEYHVAGLDTNVDFLLALSGDAEFAAGRVHTGFIEQRREQLLAARPPPPGVIAQAALALLLAEERLWGGAAAGRGLQPNLPVQRQLALRHRGQETAVRAEFLRGGGYRLHLSGRELTAAGRLTAAADGGTELLTEVAGEAGRCRAVLLGRNLHLFTKDGSWRFELPEPKYAAELRAAGGAAGAAAGAVAGAVAPMPGLVQQVLVTAGQRVQAGDPLVIVTAMKMEHLVRAPRAGSVQRLLCKPGDTVPRGAPLVALAEDAEAEQQQQQQQ